MKFLLRIAFLFIAIFAQDAFGQSTWTGSAGDGQWATAGNWTPTGEPTGDAYILNTQTNIALPTTATTLGQLNLQTSTITLTASATNFTTTLLNVHETSVLTLNIPTGGTFTTDSLANGLIGDYTGAGAVTLTGGGTLNVGGASTNGMAVGIGGTGSFTQSGSSIVTVSAAGGVLIIGADGNLLPGDPNTPTGGTGTYTINGSASLTAAGIQVGVGDTPGGSSPTVGTLNLNGGTVNVQTMFVGEAGASPVSGTVNISGGTLDVQFMNLGEGGNGASAAATGSIVQTAGQVIFADSFQIGVNSGGVGTYTLTGVGSLTGTNGIFLGINSGSSGSFTQGSGTTVTATGLVVGLSGKGNYLLQGGDVTLSQGITIGEYMGGNGTLTQMGGTLLDSGTFKIGVGAGTGVYNYDGGTLTASQGITVGANGMINLGTSLSPTSGSNPITLSGGSFSLDSGGVLALGGTTSAGGTSGVTGTGNLNFAGGTLTVRTGGLTDSLNSTISGSSTLDTTAGSATLSGTLTGSGSLNVVGTNTVTLSGTSNSGSWGATLAGGSTLTATSITSLSTTGSYMIGSGSTFNLTSTGSSDVFEGSISGAGAFNPNITTKLELAQCDLTGSSSTTISGGGTLVVDSGTISNISGAANIFDVGNGTSTGSVTLLGTNTLAQVNVMQGSTLVANNITGQVTNNGTLTAISAPGATTVNGNLISTGNLSSATPLPTSAGPTQATFTISGNLTQSTGSITIRTNGVAADEYLIEGAGMSTVSGKVNLTGFGNATYTIIATPNGTVSSSGLSLPAPTASLFSATLSNPTGSAVILTTTQIASSIYSQTPTERNVANAVDSFLTGTVTVPTSSLPNFLKFNSIYSNLPPGQFPAAQEQLSPTNLQYMRDIAFENATYLAQRMNGVDADLRNGYSGLDTSAISIVSPGFESGLGRSLGTLLASDDPGFHSAAPNGVNYYPTESGTGSPSPSAVESTGTSPEPGFDPSKQVISDSPNPYLANVPYHSSETPKFSEFVAGDVILADLNKSGDLTNAPSSSAKYTAGGMTAGISFRATNNFAAGILFDYNHTDAETDGNGSKTKVDSYSPGIYATYFEKGFYANGLFSFGYNNYENTRELPTFGTAAQSSPDGQQYIGNLDVGYDFHPDKAWVVGPTLGATYTHLDIDSIQESGAGFEDLSINSQSLDSIRSRLGSHVLYQTLIGDVLLQPSFTAMWQHEYLANASNLTSQFIELGNTSTFSTPTAAPNRDSALIGVGLTATLSSSITFYLNYLADVGDSDFFSQSVIGGLKARF